MTQIEALKMALEALLVHEYELRKVGQSFKVEPAIKALEEALAQPEQEPVAWLCMRKDGHFDVLSDKTCIKCFPVYRNPTLEQNENFCDNNCVWTDHHPDCKLSQQEQGKPVEWWCDIQVQESSCQPVEAPRCMTCGKWTDTPCTEPQQRKPLTHEQRFDLLTKFEPHKNKWEAPAILIDMVEAAHGIKE